MKTEQTSQPKLRIALCDDNIAFLESLHKKISQYFDGKGIDAKYWLFSNGDDLLNWNGMKTVDILFLDIRLRESAGDNNGISVAREMAAVNDSFLLVFVTEFLEYAPEGYEVRAFRYVLKDRLNETLNQTLDACVHELGLNRKRASFKFTNGTKEIYLDEIAYIEKVGRTVNFYNHADSEIGRIYMNMNDLIETLEEDDFVMAHKSFIVNLKYVTKLENYSFIMRSGKIIPVAQRKHPAARKAYYMFKGKII